jgi:glycosyltransferase involved in cell wall biosynthesis
MRSERPLRVLHVISSLGMGGVETWLMEVLRLWSRDGLGRMDFLLTSGKPGVFDDEARDLGAHVYCVPFRRAHLLRFANEFRKLLRAGQYDAIHNHEHNISGWHFLMGRALLPPVRVTHVHDVNCGATLVQRISSRVARTLVARYSTHVASTSLPVIAETGFNSQRFCAIPKAPLYCGFDPIRFLGDPSVEKASVCEELGWRSDAKIILAAGRLDQSPNIGHPQNHKNSAFALDVGIECARLDSRIHLIFAGKLSPAVPTLQRRVHAAGLSGRIHFAGIRKDITRLMLASDALLFPSVWEGLGMVAVEAQAAGLPVLASTAVPRECLVVPRLVRFMDLQTATTQWATALLELIKGPRDISSANRLVAASDFAIQNSSMALLRLYSTGALPGPRSNAALEVSYSDR